MKKITHLNVLSSLTLGILLGFTSSHSFAQSATPSVPQAAATPQTSTLRTKALDNLKLDAFLTFQGNVLDNADLSTASTDTRDSLSAQARMRATYDFTPYIQGQLDIRALEINGTSGAEDDSGQVSSPTDFFEVRQYWLGFDHFLSHEDLSLKIGRQRIKETAALWWNRDIDAIRLTYDTTLLNGFVAIAENQASYNTVDKLGQDQTDRLRLMGEGSWQWQYDHFLEGRLLYEEDHSSTQPVGRVYNAVERDDSDADLLWAGVRSSGAMAAPVPALTNFEYRLDGIVVAGEEREYTSTTTGSGQRIVTAIDDDDVMGWAIDSRFDFALDTSWQPVLTLGYAFGSGDDDTTDSTDHAFRQTGLHSNSGLTGMTTGSFYQYGEVLRPELSNLHVLTAGIGLPVAKFTELNIFYHYYHLDEDATSLRQSAISAALNGTDQSVGQEADIILNMNIAKTFGLESGLARDIKFRASTGVFEAGDAYGAAEGETAVRGFAELLFRF